MAENPFLKYVTQPEDEEQEQAQGFSPRPAPEPVAEETQLDYEGEADAAPEDGNARTAEPGLTADTSRQHPTPSEEYDPLADFESGAGDEAVSEEAPEAAGNEAVAERPATAGYDPLADFMGGAEYVETDTPEGAAEGEPKGSNYDTGEMYVREDGSPMRMSEAAPLYRETMEQEGSRPGWLFGPFGMPGSAVDEDGERYQVAPPSPRRTDPMDFLFGGGSFGDRVDRAVDRWQDPPVAVDLTDAALGGLAEGVGAAIELPAAMIDKAVGTDLASVVNDVFPDIDTDSSVLQSLAADAPIAVVGAMGGGAGAMKLLSKSPKVLRALGTTLAGEALASSTVSTDEGTFIMGATAAMPLFEDVIDLGDDEAARIIEQRANTFAEGLMLGGVLTTATVGAKAGYDIMSEMSFAPLFRLFVGNTGLEKAVYNEISNALVPLGRDASPEELVAAKREIARIVKANEEVIAKALDGSGDVTIATDTITSLLRGIEDPAHRAKVESVLAGYGQRADMSELQTKIDAPQRALNDQLAQQQEALGGTAVEQDAKLGLAADTLAQTGRDVVAEAEAPLVEQQSKLAAAEDALAAAANDDLQLAAKIEELGQLNGTDAVRPLTDAREGVQGAVRANYEQMREQKNYLYAAIEGGPIDIPGLVEMLDSVPDDVMRVSTTLARREPHLARFLNVVRRNTTIDEETGERLVDMDAISDTLRGAKVDFGMIYTELRPALSAAAAGFYKKGEPWSGQAIRDVVKYIDNDMVDYVSQHSPTLGKAAKDAKDYYANTFARMWGPEAGRLNDYSILYEGTLARTSKDNPAARALGEGFGQGKYDQRLEGITRNILDGGSVTEAQALKAAIEETGNPDDMADYMILGTLTEYARAFRRKGADADPEALTRGLKQYAEQLNAIAPEKAEQINAFIGRIADAQGNRSLMETMTQNVEKQAKLAREQIVSSELSFFLRNNGKGLNLDTTGEPFKAFQKLFRSSEPRADLRKIMARAADLPAGDRKVVEEGIQLAYSKHVSDVLLSRKREMGGSRPVNAGLVDKAQDGNINVLQIGEVLYERTPEVIDSIRLMLDVSKQTAQAKNARPSATMSATAYNQDAMSATNRLIYTFIGPLSRTGTRVRAITDGAIKRAAGDKVANDLAEELLTNPQKFAEASRRFDKDPKDPEALQQIAGLMWSAALKTDAFDDSEYADEQEFAADLIRTSRDLLGEQARQVRELRGTHEYDLDAPHPSDDLEQARP